MPKIIIAEDDPMIAEIYRKKFEEANFEVFSVESGDQVIISAEKNQPDVILLDLLMPKMNGFEVIRTLKTKHSQLAAKIIVSSNLSQMEDRNKALKLGADGFLVKSEFTPGTLVKEVCRITNQLYEEEKNNQKLSTSSERDNQENLPKKEKKNILLIEDEDVFIEMFGEKLRQDGFNVVTASNGTAGLKEAMSGEYDLFLIDMVMPGMNGEEIVEKLKMEDKTKNVPIVILSASADDELIRKVKSRGISAFFVKTQLVPGDLSRKISEILETHNA